MLTFIFSSLLKLIVPAVLCFIVFKSIHVIRENEVGVVFKNFSTKKLQGNNIIAFNGEAGVQAELLMPGTIFKLYPLYSVKNHPWVQVPANEIGLVVAQVGKELPTGAKSAKYKEVFGNFADLNAFIENGGEKGVQRPVLPPGTLAPLHPAAFIVFTKSALYGIPMSDSNFDLESLNLKRDDLTVYSVPNDQAIGIVTTQEGPALDEDDGIASRFGGFDDIVELEKDNSKTREHYLLLLETILKNKNNMHNSYQDYQKFLDLGGKMGIQHDVLLPGSYNLNPLLVKVKLGKMTEIKQGSCGVIKSFIGLPEKDISGDAFKHGSLVAPGHKGLVCQSLSVGRYAINPFCYEIEVVPTSILTLNWANNSSSAHKLDEELLPINAKSKEGFQFKIDLQVQIHIPDTHAAKVIASVGQISNLINEVLQSSVGNYFRNSLQKMPAIDFISERDATQEEATRYIEEKLAQYDIETRGVYIQDVTLPEDLVKVLQDREIASQSIQTLRKQQEQQEQRIEMEKQKGIADKQKDLSSSAVNISIGKNEAEQIRIKADAQKYEKMASGDGEAHYLTVTGVAAGAKIEAEGLARAKAAEALKKSLGEEGTAMVSAIDAAMKGNKPIVPEILVSSEKGGGTIEALMATMMRKDLLLKHTQDINEAPPKPSCPKDLEKI